MELTLWQINAAPSCFLHPLLIGPIFAFTRHSPPGSGPLRDLLVSGMRVPPIFVYVALTYLAETSLGVSSVGKPFLIETPLLHALIVLTFLPVVALTAQSFAWHLTSQWIVGSVMAGALILLIVLLMLTTRVAAHSVLLKGVNL